MCERRRFPFGEISAAAEGVGEVFRREPEAGVVTRHACRLSTTGKSHRERIAVRDAVVSLQRPDVVIPEIWILRIEVRTLIRIRGPGGQMAHLAEGGEERVDLASGDGIRGEWLPEPFAIGSQWIVDIGPSPAAVNDLAEIAAPHTGCRQGDLAEAAQA